MSLHHLLEGSSRFLVGSALITLKTAMTLAVTGSCFP
jgi:hypothetical protein